MDQEASRLDAFLLLDDFGTDHPDDLLPGFHWSGALRREAPTERQAAVRDRR